MTTITPDAIARLDALLANGLVSGNGDKTTTFCVEEACAAALGLPVTDHPSCVAPAVSAFGRRLNDARWAGEAARAAGMRDFAIAQLGSAGVVDEREFATRLAIRTVREVLPVWLRVAKIDEGVVAACERADTLGDARDAAVGARRAYADAYADVYAAADYAAADYAAACAAGAADCAACVYAAASLTCAACVYAAACAYAAADAFARDHAETLAITLRLSARIAVEILREMGSPGCAFLEPRQ